MCHLLATIIITLPIYNVIAIHTTPPLTSSTTSLFPSTTTTTTTTTTNQNGNLSPLDRALKWLLTQRSDDWGWHNDTAKILTALRLANATYRHLYELELSAKQLEIEIVVALWRHHDIPIAAHHLAEYAIALNVLCRDPRHFHGHDLIGTIQHHDAIKDLDFALTTLAGCSARQHIRKKSIRRLLDIANAAKDHNVDTLAMTILALRCIVKDHRHRNLQHSLRRPCIGLARQQQPDGGYGNLYSTSVTMQALNDAGECATYWNRSAAISYILQHQDPDGAFTDPAMTADVIMALANRNLGSVRNFDCGRGDVDDNQVEVDGLAKAFSNHGNDSEIRNVTVTYTLWVGSNITENNTLSITAPRNTSFYTIMQMAMDIDSNYNFEASEWPNGHYVHTLAGYKEEPMGYHYWLLYRLPEIPDPSAPPANQLVAPVGVDDLLIEEGDHYLFWYKKL